MFDIGFGEIFLLAVVALLVLGPERLPKAARFTGLWVRRARAQWYSVKAELENELADDELRRSLKQTQGELMEARESLAKGGAALQQQIAQTGEEVREAFQSDGHGGDEDREAPLGSASEEVGEPEFSLDEAALAEHGLTRQDLIDRGVIEAPDSLPSSPDSGEADASPSPDALPERAHPAGSGHDARR